jgi:hypothetical protein
MAPTTNPEVYLDAACYSQVNCALTQGPVLAVATITRIRGPRVASRFATNASDSFLDTSGADGRYITLMGPCSGETLPQCAIVFLRDIPVGVVLEHRRRDQAQNRAE